MLYWKRRMILKTKILCHQEVLIRESLQSVNLINLFCPYAQPLSYAEPDWNHKFQHAVHAFLYCFKAHDLWKTCEHRLN